MLAIKRHGAVLHLTLDRPERHNAFNEHLIAALTQALEQASQDPGLRALVLAGNGRSFSAGADLDWMARLARASEADNLGDAQARRLRIRYKDENGKTQLAHTLNNTCVAPPRMLIAFLENHLQADGTVTIPAVLQPYMGGKTMLVPKKK